MFISIWTRALLCLSLLNVIKEYYDHEGFWVIVKNFDMTHSRLPKQRKYNKSTSIVQYKHFKILERYFNTSNLRI